MEDRGPAGDLQRTPSPGEGEAGGAAASSAALPPRLLRIFLAGAAGLCVLAIIGIRLAPDYGLSDIFFLKQDLPCLVLVVLLLFSLRVSIPGKWERPGGLAVLERRSTLCLGLLLAWIVVAAAAGWPLIAHRYPLSMDEFWAAFDARIFGRGLLMAPIDPEWRPYAAALQPKWRLEVSGDRLWASTYLPLNAAARGLFGRIHLAGLASPAWAAVGAAATFASARKLWPSRPAPALVAALLLATSPQLLVASMTPYAMSALFALNSLWLLLMLHRHPLAYVAAGLVGFVACGVHQLIFHLLFAAPFVLDLFLERRWRPALLLTATYAAAAVFWASYWAILLPLVGASAKAGDGVGAVNFLHRVVALFMQMNPRGLFLMAENLVRFITWQNPLTLPLAWVGGGLALRGPGPLRALLLGVLLTLVAMSVILPYQGHGWGYRYLHGLLGPLALLAAAGFEALSRRTGCEGRWNGAAALAISAAGAIVLLLPWRSWQVYAFSQPYARAYDEVTRTDADVVIVDATGLWFGVDLVRNDPFLEGRPKVMQLSELSRDQVDRLCRTYRVALFDKRQGSRAGIAILDQKRAPEDVDKLSILSSSSCRKSDAPQPPERSADSGGASQT